LGSKKNYLVHPKLFRIKGKVISQSRGNKSSLAIAPVEELLPKDHSFQRQSGAHR
jgi:hypothetical protein